MRKHVGVYTLGRKLSHPALGRQNTAIRVSQNGFPCVVKKNERFLERLIRNL